MTTKIFVVDGVYRVSILPLSDDPHFDWKVDVVAATTGAHRSTRVSGSLALAEGVANSLILDLTPRSDKEWLFDRVRKVEKQRDALLTALSSLNHMGGDERGGYCICPRNDGSAPDHEHASGCADARAVIAKVREEMK